MWFLPYRHCNCVCACVKVSVARLLTTWLMNKEKRQTPTRAQDMWLILLQAFMRTFCSRRVLCVPVRLLMIASGGLCWEKKKADPTHNPSAGMAPSGIFQQKKIKPLPAPSFDDTIGCNMGMRQEGLRFEEEKNVYLLPGLLSTKCLLRRRSHQNGGWPMLYRCTHPPPWEGFDYGSPRKVFLSIRRAVVIDIHKTMEWSLLRAI